MWQQTKGITTEREIRGTTITLERSGKKREEVGEEIGAENKKNWIEKA